MKRLLLAGLAAAAIAVAGCGGDDEADSPLDEAVGHLPDDAPLVISLSTDVEGDDYQAVGDLLEKFPQGSQVADQLRSQIEEQGVDYEDDVKPILGNELVIGFPDAEAMQENRFVAAIETEDGDKAEDLIQRESSEDGEKDDYALYRSENDETYGAVKDDTLVFASDKETVEQAIEDRGGDSRLTEDDFNDAFEDLPEDALLRLFGDTEALLAASPQSEQARQVKWVDGMRDFAMTADVADDGVSFDFRIATEGLSEEDLPIAAGSESPGVVERPNEIAFALKNPTQLIEFAQDAGQAVNPTEYGQFEAAKDQIGQAAGIDVDRDLIGQFTGDTTVSMAIDGTFAARSELEDADAFRTTLEKVAERPELLEGAAQGGELEVPRGGEDLYGLVTGGGERLVFGVVGDVFVIGNAPRKVEQIAAAEPTPVEDAEGALVMKADAEAIANQVVSQVLAERFGGLGSLFGQASQFTGPLGDLTGSVQAETDALTGRFKLAIDE